MNDGTAQHLFDALAAEHLREPGTGRRRMFGRDGLSANGTFFAFLDHDRLAVKLPPGTASALIAAGEAVVATSLSPTMRTWVLVPMPSAGADRRWRRLVAEARAYASPVPSGGPRSS